MNRLGTFNASEETLAREMWEFRTCQRSDGSYYGTGGQCRKGTETDKVEKEEKKGKGGGGGSFESLVSSSEAAALNKQKDAVLSISKTDVQKAAKEAHETQSSGHIAQVKAAKDALKNDPNLEKGKTRMLQAKAKDSQKSIDNDKKEKAEIAALTLKSKGKKKEGWVEDIAEEKLGKNLYQERKDIAEAIQSKAIKTLGQGLGTVQIRNAIDQVVFEGKSLKDFSLEKEGSSWYITS